MVLGEMLSWRAFAKPVGHRKTVNNGCFTPSSLPANRSAASLPPSAPHRSGDAAAPDLQTTRPDGLLMRAVSWLAAASLLASGGTVAAAVAQQPPVAAAYTVRLEDVENPTMQKGIAAATTGDLETAERVSGPRGGLL